MEKSWQQPSQTWQKVLDILKNQVSGPNYKTWFSKTQAEMVDNQLIVRVPSNFIKDNLATKLRSSFEPVLQEVFGEIPYEIKVDPGLISSKEEADFEFSLPTPQTSVSSLNPRYTLDNFVVGLSNNLAFAAAQAVVQNPGTSYNPLFVYGGTGVGKTHLMLGIGNALVRRGSLLKVIYCSLEKFTNDFVQGIQSKRMGDFRAKYRNCDLLLVDDVQFISGRDSTQEEFFHTFNELQTKNAQIVLTSDRPPNEIQKLEGRLASRFQGGLMVDIQLPDFDTRVAILKAKCLERGEVVDEKILSLIAESMPTNARELEGKLIQLLQAAKANQTPMTEDLVRNQVGKPIVNGSQKLDYKKVFTEINRYFNIKMSDLSGPRRKKELVLPRQIAMYILYEECKIPYERIGEMLGGRDHTTIMHGVNKINQAQGRDREVQRMLIEIKQELVG